MIGIITGIVIGKLLCDCEETQIKQPEDFENSKIYFLKNRKDIERRAKDGDMLSEALLSQAIHSEWV